MTQRLSKSIPSSRVLVSINEYPPLSDSNILTMSPSPVEELALLDLDRSNKGASKQRRDLINAEIALMRDLLPLPESARQRLSQLQIMSLSCVYIRKCNVLQKLYPPFAAKPDMPSWCDFFQSLTGFLLITTREGKLVYISENVTDYLGHSMVDMKTQGDSLYDIVDKRDHGTVQAQLLQGGADPDVTRDVAFFCRMNMSRTLKRQSGFGDVKVMHVRGHFILLSDPDSDVTDQQPQQQRRYIFMATCSPLVTPEVKENLIQSNTMIFKTVHQLDMTFLEVTKTAEFHLGCSTEEICKKSWYSMLHPEDIHEAQEKHVLLIRSSLELGCMMTVRMLNAEGHTLWVNVVLHVQQSSTTQNEEPVIICINQVISEEEAFQIRMQSHMFTLYPPRSTDMWTAGMPSSSAMGHPQLPQPDTSGWVPAAMTSHGGQFQGPMNPYYVASQHHQAILSPNYPSMHDRSGYQLNLSSSPNMLHSMHEQTNKVKQMLKRKIHDPCRPAKMPKLACDQNIRGSITSMQGLEYAASANPMHSPNSVSQLTTEVTGGGYRWPSSAQVVPHFQYRMAHVLPLTLSHQHDVKAALMSLPHLDTLSSPTSPPAYFPETKVKLGKNVAVPESFLTPDPSPASSPNPQAACPNIKTEEVGQGFPLSSVTILQKLKTITDHLHQAEPSAASVASPAIAPNVKTEGRSDRCCHTSSKRELPIINAFEVENFFGTLDSGKRFTALSSKSTGYEKNLPTASTAKMEVSVNIPAALTMEVPFIKQELMDAEYNSLSSKQSSIQPQPRESVVDHSELEELLNFFSDDVTTTQLTFTDSLVNSSTAKNDVDMQVESVKPFTDNCRQEGKPCGAGHLANFLLDNTDLERSEEGFSPVSNFDMSGDEEGIGKDPLETLVKQDIVEAGHGCDGQYKRNNMGQHAQLSTSFGSCRNHFGQQISQDIPGTSEEDELHQLNKLLASVTSDSGMMLSEEPQ